MTRRFAAMHRPRQHMTWGEWIGVSIASLFAVMAFAVIMFMALLVKPSWGHEAMGWSYPWECCAGHDCAEIAASRVKEAPGGYLVDGRFPVRHSEVKQSPDGHYHACFPNPETLRCLFIPPSGS